MTIEPAPPNQPYLNAFLTERPKDGIEVIQGRLRKALKLNEELAEYFRERAHVEDLYAKNLAKISKKHFVTDKSALGQMQPIWEMLQNELTEIYTIHAVMSLKITEDVERPLRSAIQNDNEYAAMDASLQRLSKDYEERLARLNKHKKAATRPGGGKAESKVADSTKGLEGVKSQWMQTGPEYIQKHQAVDEHRWDNLRTVVQKFEVLQNDQLLKRIEVANNVLTAASNFNIEDEINAFCSSRPANGLKKALSTQQIQQQPQQQQPSVSHSEQSIASLGSSSTTTAHGDVLSVPTTMTNNNNVPDNLEAPVPVPSVSEKSNRSGRKMGKERKFLSTLVSIRRKTKNDHGGSTNNGYMNADLAPPVMHHTDQHSHSSFSALDEENGSHVSSMSPSNDGGSTMSPAPTSPTSVDQPAAGSLKKAPSFSGSFASSQHQQPPKVLLDAEGYTIPPPDRAAWPGDSIVSSLHDDDFGSDSGSNQQKLKVDIKNEAMKEEDATHAAVALTRVSSMLKEKSPTASGRRRGRRDTQQRNTRLLDPVQEIKPPVSTTASSPSPLSVASSPFEDEVNSSSAGNRVQLHDAPVQLEDPSVSVFDDQNNGVQLHDAPVLDEQQQEQRQQQGSVAAASMPVVPSPTMTPFTSAQPTIRVQITESIHCLMKGGAIVRSAVLGEVKIAYRGPVDTMGRSVCFRLEHVDQLERIAPNTGYISPMNEGEKGQNGVYKLDTNMFNLAGDSPVPCIKYQVKQSSSDNNDDNDDMVLPPQPLVAPIQVKPMWKCEAEQTLLLVKYQKADTELASHLHGVFFMTTVSGNVQNVQSVPGGQWMVDQDKMVWPMGEWNSHDERVLRAKFTTKEQGTPQALQIRFEAKDRLVSTVDVASSSSNGDGQEDGSMAIWANVESTEKSIRTGKYIAEQ
ncbi:Muniscin C-terminal mu homology domain-containing protein [Zychaea mexicana]|uniref:muniscin domain-containing protein n=1 Tax=Zychaea mexicana TaxID=64656 RepID=UPI0022FEC8EE|nr:muniscin domain-containing protein [Zychaea mexicana]KAI9485130.1 Muniscin C-terminal mu homology domain-containing protein [Zychaea mexicana]